VPACRAAAVAAPPRCPCGPALAQPSRAPAPSPRAAPPPARRLRQALLRPLTSPCLSAAALCLPLLRPSASSRPLPDSKGSKPTAAICLLACSSHSRQPCGRCPSDWDSPRAPTSAEQSLLRLLLLRLASCRVGRLQHINERQRFEKQLCCLQQAHGPSEPLIARGGGGALAFARSLGGVGQPLHLLCRSSWLSVASARGRR
jgi:hypothetical protein